MSISLITLPTDSFSTYILSLERESSSLKSSQHSPQQDSRVTNEVNKGHMNMQAGFKNATKNSISLLRNDCESYISTFQERRRKLQAKYRPAGDCTQNRSKIAPSFQWLQSLGGIQVSGDLLDTPESSLCFISNVDSQHLFKSYHLSLTNIDSEQLGESHDLYLSMLSKFDLSSVVKCSSIETPLLAETINKKFILFLQGKYRVLKSFDDSNQTRFSSDLIPCIRRLASSKPNDSQEVSALVIKQVDNLSGNEEQIKLQFSAQQSRFSTSTIASTYMKNQQKPHDEVYANKTQHDSTTSLESHQPTPRKQIFHNLSKYLMHLILELLSSEHLKKMCILSGYERIIAGVISRTRDSGKRRAFSQTHYFNHSHYNCFFLVITEENKDRLLNNKDFMRISRKVFGEVDFNNPKEVLDVNIIKRVIGHIVQTHLKFVVDKISANFDSSTFELGNIKTDCQAKIFYLNSAYLGIDKLLKGQLLIRF